MSKTISESSTFRSKKTVERLRSEYIVNNVLNEDIVFNSPSTAANFVCGSSTNGLIAWRDEFGKSIKKLISDV